MTKVKPHGLAHATLTVSNIQKTKKFYEEIFETSIKLDNKKSFSLLQVSVPCWFVQWGRRYPNDRFGERRIGLDHIAFKLETLEELEHIIKRLDL